ncbi:MAG TPA: DinB family protein [Blastocatellia bacterium]|nr:DinB family protein [Blastocatellia bacterium]
MKKNQIRIAVLMCGLGVMLGTALPAASYPPYVRQAAKFGAKDCLFCHTKAEGGEGWNDVGKWLMDERDRRKADSIDVNWLADYKPGSAASAGRSEAGKSAAALTADERAKAVKLLQDALDETLRAVENLTDAQWNYKPAPDKWSVGQVSEHILKAEGLLFGVVEKTLTSPVNPDWAQTEGKTEMLEKAVLNREQKFQAPEPLQPSGNLTRAEFISQFKEARARTIKYAEETSQPLKEHTADHPALKTLNGYQWLLLIPLHNMRHNLQINEVKMSAGFPK